MKRMAVLVVLATLCGTATAQIIDSLPPQYISDPGVRPVEVFKGFGNDDGGRFDLNGDGIAELIMQRNDVEGNLKDLLVRDGESFLQIYPDVQETLSLSGKRMATGEAFEFWGFADPDNDGFREAIFFNQNEVALIDLRAPQLVNWRSSIGDLGFPPELRLLGVGDMTGDGIEEIIIALPQARQIIVFGAR